MKRKELREGTKFKTILNNYQFSLIKNKLVIVSWIEQGNILSTDYSLKSVLRNLEEGVWEIISDDACIVHL